MNRCTTQDKQLLFLLSQLSPFAIVSFWHFPSVIQHLFQLYSYNFVDMYIQMNRCSAHKIDNCSWLFHLSLGPNKHGLVTCIQVNVNIGNSLLWLNGGWAFKTDVCWRLNNHISIISMPFAILDCAFILLLLIIILIRYVSKKPGYNAFWHFFPVSIYFGCSIHSDGVFEYPQQIYVMVVK